MSARLDAELVRRGLARSRAEASRAIDEGRVSVGGAVAAKPSRRVNETDELTVTGVDRWVARSAHKLIAALDAFGVDPRGVLCLDVGASTGGFTQVLLDRGAREVIALDVGHGQLVEELRTDARVRVVEGANARELTPDSLATLAGTSEAPTLAVVDVSFIPLRLVLPPIAGVLAPSGTIVALIKPQFEAGRTLVREGVVADRAVRHEAVRGVLALADAEDWGVDGPIASPIVGSHGNTEYLCALRTGRRPHPTEWEPRLAALD